MNISDLPEGSVIEIDGERYELTAEWRFSDGADVMTKEQASAYPGQAIKIISVPFEVTLKLAEWLDSVYTSVNNKTATDLIVEAAEAAMKDKRTRYISNLPKKTGEPFRISVASRVDAEAVLRGVEEVGTQYGTVSISDVHDLVGMTSNFTDSRWGWKDGVVARITINRVRGGYDVVFPNPERF